MTNLLGISTFLKIEVQRVAMRLTYTAASLFAMPD